MPDGNGGQNITWLSELINSGLGYVWFVVLAVWGGTVNYLSRIKRFKQTFSIAELFGEWFISGFAGLITAYVCTNMGFDFYITAAASGVAGHMGGRSIFLLEQLFAKKIGVSVQREQDKKND